jgi:hypothetical protein
MRFSRRGGTPEPAVERPRATPPGELPLVAAITMTRDEGPMIRHWAAHYARELGAENVYVIDDHSTDGSTEDVAALGCHVLKFPYLNKYGFEQSRIGLVNALSAGLLMAYDAVLFTDADEFVVADPERHAGLRAFVAARPDVPALGYLGYNVVQDLAHEGPLDFSRPLLEQRQWAKYVPLMSKPGLKWDPVPWARASHGIKVRYDIDPDLIMFHFKFADRDQLLARAGNRHHLNQTENRARNTSWAKSGDEMVQLLDEVSAALDPAKAVRFKPQPALVERTVQLKGEVWKAVGEGQVQAMHKRAFCKIPQRFAGLV